MPALKSFSIRKNLIIWLSVPILLAVLTSAVLASLFAWHEVDEVYDAQMVNTARVLLTISQDEIVSNGDFHISQSDKKVLARHKYEKNGAFRIWYHDKLVTYSMRAAEFDDFIPPLGFSNQRLKDKPWRFFSFVDPMTNIRVETAERYAIRYELIWQLTLSILIPTVIFMPVFFLIVWVGVRRGLHPITAISGMVNERDTNDLTQVSTPDVPLEILPLTQALDALFTRIGESFRREREFTDHAAHELRTPLAAMKTQTQVLMRRLGGSDENAQSLQNLNATIDRTNHLIEQLLSLARLQNETLPMSAFNLSDLIEEAIAEVQSIAHSKGQVIHKNIAERVYSTGHGDSLYILLRNLIDNAIKYSPLGTSIGIELTPQGVLKIADHGPGLSETQKRESFERFVRFDKTGQGGSGLGLSIVRWIAQAHDMDVSFEDNQPTGLIAVVAFQPAMP